MLEYKTTWYGSRLVVAPRFCPSTKTRSVRGDVNAEIPLGERVFRREACGMEIDRDLNAARDLASLVAGSSPDGKRLWRTRPWSGELPSETGCREAGISKQETGRFGGGNKIP